jgi:hypothetical protein
MKKAGHWCRFSSSASEERRGKISDDERKQRTVNNLEKGMKRLDFKTLV